MSLLSARTSCNPRVVACSGEAASPHRGGSESLPGSNDSSNRNDCAAYTKTFVSSTLSGFWSKTAKHRLGAEQLSALLGGSSLFPPVGSCATSSGESSILERGRSRGCSFTLLSGSLNAVVSVQVGT